jgi:hypothetical protein
VSVDVRNFDGQKNNANVPTYRPLDYANHCATFFVSLRGDGVTIGVKSIYALGSVVIIL